MKFQHHNSAKKSHWQTYKALELIPDSTPNPQANKRSFAFGLDHLWRLVLVALTEEMLDEQQVEHLERCWALNADELLTTVNANGWCRLWWDVLTQ